MVAKIFCILIFAVLCESRKSLVPQAILQLVRSNYGERPVVIEVFYNSKQVEIFDETLKMLSSEKKLKVTSIDMNDLIKFNLEYCKKDFEGFCFEVFLKNAIFLFDTLENYEKLKWNISLSERFKTELNHLVYCEDASERKIQHIITRDTYESFLLVKNDRISLHTMTRFTEKQCSAEQMIEINQFSSLERKWKTEKFFVPVIENFHGCELRILFYPFPGAGLPFIRVLKAENGTETAEGSIVDMFNALSTHLNFTATHARFKYESNDVSTNDFMISADPLRVDGKLYCPSSDPIYSTSDIYVVPPGELYTSWEKLLLPFDWETWMWLAITFAVAFLVIFLIIVSKSTTVYDLVIGTNVTTPNLNVIAIFMGIGQIMLPERNVTRFLFINFVLFSLIMRTAYQGKYFEFLTSDMRRKPMQTIEELKENDFTLIFDE